MFRLTPDAPALKKPELIRDVLRPLESRPGVWGRGNCRWRPVASAIMNSTWDARDFRVLEAIVQIAEDTGRDSVRAAQIADRTGLSDENVQAALRALSSEEPPFFMSSATSMGPF